MIPRRSPQAANAAATFRQGGKTGGSGLDIHNHNGLSVSLVCNRTRRARGIVVTYSKHPWSKNMTQETYIQACHIPAVVEHMVGGFFQG